MRLRWKGKEEARVNEWVSLSLKSTRISSINEILLAVRAKMLVKCTQGGEKGRIKKQVIVVGSCGRLGMGSIITCNMSFSG